MLCLVVRVQSCCSLTTGLAVELQFYTHEGVLGVLVSDRPCLSSHDVTGKASYAVCDMKDNPKARSGATSESFSHFT